MLRSVAFFCGCLMLLASGAQAQDMELAGQYELRSDGVEGDMSISPDPEGYGVEIFTSNDGAAHFCLVEGTFVQEEKVLVELHPLYEEGPRLLIMIREGYLEILEGGEGSCGLNQSIVGKYYPE